MAVPNLLFDLSNRMVIKIYKCTLNFPQKYQFSVGDQLRRSSLSIVLNIVEGGARLSFNEKRQFMNISYGSLKETKYLLYFSKELGLIERSFYIEIMEPVNELARVLYTLLYKNKKA